VRSAAEVESDRYVSIPIDVLIWLMIYPMMMKVDVASIKNVGKNPKGLFVTWITDWLIEPFTMFGIAWLFFFVIYKSLIPVELAQDYLIDYSDFPYLFCCISGKQSYKAST